MAQRTLIEQLKSLRDSWEGFKLRYIKPGEERISSVIFVDNTVRDAGVSVKNWTGGAEWPLRALKNVLQNTDPNRWDKKACSEVWIEKKTVVHFGAPGERKAHPLTIPIRDLSRLIVERVVKEANAYWEWRPPGTKKRIYVSKSYKKVLPDQPWFENPDQALAEAAARIPDFVRTLIDRTYYILKRSRSYKYPDGVQIKGHFVKIKFYYKKPNLKSGTYLTDYVLGECQYERFKKWEIEQWGFLSGRLPTPTAPVVSTPPPAIPTPLPYSDIISELEKELGRPLTAAEKRAVGEGRGEDMLKEIRLGRMAREKNKELKEGKITPEKYNAWLREMDKKYPGFGFLDDLVPEPAPPPKIEKTFQYFSWWRKKDGSLLKIKGYTRDGVINYGKRLGFTFISGQYGFYPPQPAPFLT